MIKTMLLEDDYDLSVVPVREDGMIVSGIALGDTERQRVDVLLMSRKGDYKEHPAVGVGLEAYIKSTGRSAELVREIRIQLEAEGFTNADIDLQENGALTIDI